MTDRSVGYSAGGDLYTGAGMGIKALDAATLKPLWNDPSILCSSQTPMLADVDKDGTLEVIVADQSNSGIAVYNAADGSVSTTVTESGTIYRKGNTACRLTLSPRSASSMTAETSILSTVASVAPWGRPLRFSCEDLGSYTWKPVGIGKLQNTTIPPIRLISTRLSRRRRRMLMATVRWSS